jgi:acyl-CoA thioester hydrolase
VKRFDSFLTVRGYELDGFGHVNHSVYLNYFEHARFEALEEGGYSLGTLAEQGMGVHVVRIEVDYRRELRLGDRVRVETWVDEWRNSSIVIAQEAFREGSNELVAEARVVAVWVGTNRKPIRVPEAVRKALGAEDGENSNARGVDR